MSSQYTREPIPVAGCNDSRPIWTTDNEISFLGHLFERNRQAFKNYAELILGRARRWDKTVNARAVEDHVRGLLLLDQRQKKTTCGGLL